MTSDSEKSASTFLETHKYSFRRYLQIDHNLCRPHSKISHSFTTPTQIDCIKMAPGVGRFLADAGLAGTVTSMNEAFDGNYNVTAMEPTVPLTNGILLDLFRIARKSASTPRRLVGLLHSLGYIAATDPVEQKKWDYTSSRLHAQAARNTKKKALAKRLLQVRNDCIQPGSIGDGPGSNCVRAPNDPAASHSVSLAVLRLVCLCMLFVSRSLP